ncbi:hypothetical protein HLB23_30555 [Nocardia uniformis]|uniref:Uncharacterized protein n=1 Tax=Nocardia uniformis TaxID=53432 RepID=A0A849C692_9NOCA|nr:hypothetical protein [Nocardia uniformis]NNH74142.1 hypothetical protein [Nocardia uniformis]
MASEHDECTVTVSGVAPSMVSLLRFAASIARDNGRNWVGAEDLWAALVADNPTAPIWWPREGKPRITRGWKGSIGRDADGNMLTSELQGDTVALSYPEFRDYVTTWVPGPTPEGVGPAEPATVTYEISGPHAEEFTAMLERS